VRYSWPHSPPDLILEVNAEGHLAHAKPKMSTWPIGSFLVKIDSAMKRDVEGQDCSEQPPTAAGSRFTHLPVSGMKYLKPRSFTGGPGVCVFGLAQDFAGTAFSGSAV